jgi:hypothetical protein
MAPIYQTKKWQSLLEVLVSSQNIKGIKKNHIWSIAKFG